MMMYWQEGISVFIAVFCAVFVIREFVQPFLTASGCGRCGGCDGGKDLTLKIEPVQK